MKPRRGRPPGRRTNSTTPAMRRAQAFFELKRQGLSPNQAAKVVAADWQVTESTVFKDWERHQSRLFIESIRALHKARERFVLAVADADGRGAAQQALREIWLEEGKALLDCYPGPVGAFLEAQRANASRLADELETHDPKAAETFRQIVGDDSFLLEVIGQSLVEFEKEDIDRFFTGS